MNKFTNHKLWNGLIVAICVLLISSCTSSAIIYSDNNTIDKKNTGNLSQKELLILKTLEQYSPTGYFIVNTDVITQPPRNKGVSWNKFNFGSIVDNISNETEFIKALPTVVHETNHDYTDEMAAVLDSTNIKVL